MSTIRTILILLTLSILPAAMAEARDTAEVRSIISGGAFVTGTGDTITLLGVATGTSRTIASDDDARSYLALILNGRKVILIRDSLVADRSEGPKPRYVYLPDGVLVNLSMIILKYAAAAEKPLHSRFIEFQAAEKLSGQPDEEVRNSERSTAVQCSGTTKKGARCKRMTKSGSGRCWQHE